VCYEDFKRKILGLTTPLDLLMYKRASFAYELEVRAIIESLLTLRTVPAGVSPFLSPYGLSTSPGDLEVLRTAAASTPEGVVVRVDLEELIQDAYVSPGTPDWYLDVVRSVCDRYGLARTPVRSSMDDLA
jgi:hypothetical protein